MHTPNIQLPQPYYLTSINHALYLDEASGNVVLRTGFSGDIIISGNVNIPGNVDAHISEIGTSGELSVPWMPVSIDGNANVTVSGTVDVSSLPAITGNVGVVGNVNIGTMPNVNAAVSGTVAVSSLPAITGNVGVISIGNVDVSGNTLPISGNVSATLDSNTAVTISGFGGAITDAFGRLRVSNPQTLYDTHARYYDHRQFSSSTSGIANVVYEANSSTYMCNVGTSSGDSVLRESIRVFPYQPGKSLLVLSTFCMATPKANLRQRIGYFTQLNGVFFEVADTTLYMVIRSNSSGSVIEDRIPQSQWNGDSLSSTVGVNPSGITLNPALDQIWFCDIEWLGVGSVRVGFIIDGVYITCHTFNHANTPSTGTSNNTTTYMTTATLPLRCEITNTGITASSSMLRQICSSVISEGGFQASGSGVPRAASHLITSPIRLTNDSNFRPIMSIRLKSTMLDAVVIPMKYSIVPISQSIFQYRIYKRAITSGGTWVSSGSDSSVEYNLAPTTLVSGDIAEQNFINSTNQSSGAPTQIAFAFNYQLERDAFTNIAYEYVITMATTGTNQDIYSSMEWQEIT